MAQLHDAAIGLDHFVGVSGPQRDQPRNGAQRCQVFYRLVSRAVLSVAHGVMSEHENGGQFHQRRQTDGRPEVIAEDKECRAEGPELGEGDPVHNRSHGVLPDAIVKVLPARGISLEISGALKGQESLVRWPQVGRASEEPANILREHIEHFARGFSPRHALRVGRKYG